MKEADDEENWNEMKIESKNGQVDATVIMQYETETNRAIKFFSIRISFD